MLKWTKESKTILINFKKYLRNNNCNINFNIDKFIKLFIKENNIKTITESNIILILKIIKNDFCLNRASKFYSRMWCN